ncbi:BspA family leucine-rich repeat surface protein [Mycoplasma mycoides]|uniref:BspA family leucine-rich repeat surface protein n=1 Tax=Mycoplasma mycoides TaxID=2102 RepID=UPI00223F01BA|nr:BspA family leucine-rich repeat surface protein [Mycoplasma mycoides]QVJ95609.1 BspA family leucine-rich repeat surface protein [Mycoplasma mycoides subsp. capri]
MKINLLILTIAKLSLLSFSLIVFLKNENHFNIDYKMQMGMKSQKTEQPHKYKDGDKTEIVEIGFYKRGNEITIKQIPYYVKKVPEKLPEEIVSLYRAFAHRYKDQNHPTVTGFEKWDTSKIKNMSYAFYDNELIDADLSEWKTDNVFNMHGMFKNAIKFNNKDKPLNWNTEKVESMESMFDGAESFKQNLKDWKVEKVTKNKNFSRASGIFEHIDKKPSWKVTEHNDPIIKKSESTEPKVIIHPSPSKPKPTIPLTKLINPIIKSTPNSNQNLEIPKTNLNTTTQQSKKLSTPAIVGIVVGSQVVLTSLATGIPYLIKRFKK